MGFYKNVNADIKEFQVGEDLYPGNVRKIILKKNTRENLRYDHTEKHYMYRDARGMIDFNCHDGDTRTFETYDNSYYTSSEKNNYFNASEYNIDYIKYDDIAREWEIIFEAMSIDTMEGKRQSTRQRHACSQCALRDYCDVVDGKQSKRIPECHFETVDGSEGNIFFREVEKRLISEDIKEEITASNQFFK